MSSMTEAKVARIGRRDPELFRLNICSLLKSYVLTVSKT